MCISSITVGCRREVQQINEDWSPSDRPFHFILTQMDILGFQIAMCDQPAMHTLDNIR
ncbi:hypothetical protein D3C71_1345080 [compost metagenome]